MTKFESAFTWLGGALFVGALAATVYTFAVGWARTAAVPTFAAVAWNVVLFTVFASHHSVFARERVKDVVLRVIPPRLLRSFYVWTASLLLLLVLAFWKPVGGTVYDAHGAAAVALALVQLAGIGLIASSVATIDGLELAGIRARSGPDGLQVRGPYRVVRHPLYLGWMLAVFGSAHMTGDRLTFAIITAFYLFVAMPWEERALRAAFGGAYIGYERTVRWRLVPHVY